jgi:hypothetical protein
MKTYWETCSHFSGYEAVSPRGFDLYFSEEKDLLFVVLSFLLFRGTGV